MNARSVWARLAAPLLLASIITALGTAGTPSAAPASSQVDAAPSPAGLASSVEGVVDLVIKRNPSLRSYSASAHLDLQQVNFPYLHPVLDGHEYVSAPGYTVFDYPHTPFYLKGITKVQGAFGNADRWLHCYDISMTQAPGAYRLHMVPKINGEISAVDVLLGRDGAIDQVKWSYHENPNDGLTLTQTYAVIDGYSVVTQQASDVSLHHIRAKGTQTFSGFAFNVPVPTPTPTPSDPLHQCDN